MSDEIGALIQSLSNSDIEWDGTAIGFVPRIAGTSASKLLDMGQQPVPQLMEALADREKYIAAHVLLTLATGVEYVTIPWNGLELHLSANNSVTADADSQRNLVAQWKAWRLAHDATHAPDDAKHP